jgi:two-component system, sensor histidine kinase and response regulator
MMDTSELGSTPVNVLVVDDVADNLIALEGLLARPDLRVLTAPSGTAALETMLVHEVALAIIDVHMPNMNGFELAELMRGSARTSHVPIIFVTAEPHDHTRQFRGYEAGAVDFLSKPIEPRVLRSKLDVFVKLFRQQLELTRQVERLQEALALNETFVAVLGHDLRDPLNAITVGASLLRAKSSEAVTATTSARILRSSTRMARMIDQLLFFARARSGQHIHISPRAADLRELVEISLEDCCDVGELGSRVRVTSRGNLAGSWDPDRLQQVIINLVSNALRHGAPGGPVRVDLEGRDESRVRLTVANDGSIPPELLPRAFEPFRSSSGGLGLGLYIVQRFVGAHGGSVEVRSTEAEGTCFSVELPRRCHMDRAISQHTAR